MYAMTVVLSWCCRYIHIYRYVPVCKVSTAFPHLGLNCPYSQQCFCGFGIFTMSKNVCKPKKEINSDWISRFDHAQLSWLQNQSFVILVIWWLDYFANFICQLHLPTSELARFGNSWHDVMTHWPFQNSAWELGPVSNFKVHLTPKTFFR